MRQCIVLALFVIYSLQGATSFDQNNVLSYEDYYLYPKRGPHSELHRETKYPAYPQYGLEQFQKAKEQIPQGSEIFSLEMIGVRSTIHETNYFGMKN